MSELCEVLKFTVMAQVHSALAGHTSYKVEGWLNIGLEEHLASCAECRGILARDLRDFALQIEQKGKP